MDLKKFLGRRVKKLRNENSKLELAQFSEPMTIFINQVKSIEMRGNVPMVNIEVTSKVLKSLKDAVELNRMVVRSVERRLHPQVGDIITVIEDDPTDVYKQILFELARRGKI
jgi:hypothetical protein